MLTSQLACDQTSWMVSGLMLLLFSLLLSQLMSFFSILMPDEIKQKLKVDTEKCMVVDSVTGEEIEGLLLVDILVDQNEHYPHIYYKTVSTGECIAGNCRLCIETKSTVCNHGPEDRMLHVSVFSFNNQQEVFLILTSLGRNLNL